MTEPNRKQKRAAKAQAKKASKKKAPKTAKEAVLEVAKRLDESESIEVTLTTGARVTLHPVSPSLIQDVQAAIENPPVPTFWNENKERDEENPNSPAYLAALEHVQAQRIRAILDAEVMFGVELEEGFEVPDKWVSRLKLLADRHGMPFDENDPADVEFSYKKAGMSDTHFALLSRLSGISEEDLDQFRDLFRS